MEIKKLLLKYDLEDPIILLESPVQKKEWKRTVNKAINFKWKTQLLETKKLYKNLQYLNVGNPYYKGIHNLLRINCKSARNVDRIPVKFKLITGTYLLPASKAAIKKNGNDSNCLVCGKDDETVEHVILQCPALAVVRDPVITEISFILYEQHRINFDTFNIQKKIQTILDFSNLIRNKEYIQTWSQLEFQNRRLLHITSKVRKNNLTHYTNRSNSKADEIKSYSKVRTIL